MNLLKKALRLSAFFVSCLPLAVPAADKCLPKGATEPIKIERVVDGDTVRDSSGRKLRLVGVNTPELNPRTGDAEYMALEAKHALDEWIESGELAWISAVMDRDRHGRSLGYLTIDGVPVAKKLIEQGLGWAVAIAPNLQVVDCLLETESEAREKNLGVWRDSPIKASQVDRGGFAVVLGTITKIDLRKTSVFIELDDNLVIKLSVDAPVLLKLAKRLSLGETLEARGWISDRSEFVKKRPQFKRFMMNLNAIESLKLF